jgi:aminoglycoside phosphotransferase (APT) family kinase protein
LRPENAIDSWRQWSADLSSRPVILGTLDGGRSNRSFLLDSDIGRLVLRINGTGSLLPGASRSNEIGIWKAASKQGIAPPLLYVDKQNQFLVSTYINTDLPPKPQLDTTFVDHAFKLLEACHRLDVHAPDINYSSHIEHYWQLIEAKNQPPNPVLNETRKPMQSLLDSLINSNTPTGLCHHDPVIENFVGNPDRLYLIDWEYAANGLQIMDYAALATEWQLDDTTILSKTGLKPELLVMAKTLYAYLCALWEAATT